MNLNLHYRYGGNRHALYKFLLVMKLIVILITTAIMQVSASSFAQKITLNKNSAPLSQIINEIRVQSGYDFFYNKTLLKSARPVTIKVQNASIEEVLEICFKNQPLEFQIEEKTVMIKEKEKSVLEKIVDRFQAIDVRGKVVDATSGEGLPGANVKVKGLDRVASTDKDGNFSLQDVSEDAVLEISYIGYVTKTVKAGKDVGIIRLEMATSDLQEVTINKGYYTEKKALSTGSVVKITAEEIERSPVNDPLLALQGRVAGLFIEPNSGRSGAAVKLSLRGKNSIQSGVDPLYIVDGVPFNSQNIMVSPTMTSSNAAPNGVISPFFSINPRDIESIEILKDADATAIYGSRGANGVILITTKKGKNGKAKITADISTGGGKVARFLDLMNTQEYLQMRYQALKNDNLITPQDWDYDINGTWDTTRYTDWQKELMGGTARMTTGQLSVSGGNATTTYLASGTYQEETEVFLGSGKPKKGSFLLAISNESPNEKFKSRFSTNYTMNSMDAVAGDLTGTALSLMPNAPSVFDDQGKLNWENSTFENPVASSLEQKYKFQSYNLVSNGTLSYQILPGLEVKSNFGINSLKREEFRTAPSTIYDPAYGITPSSSRLWNSEGSSNTWNVEPQISWAHSTNRFGKISILMGGTLQTQESQYQGYRHENFATNALILSPQSASVHATEGYLKSVYKYNAIFGRFNYTYDDRYVFNLTGRRDGSSRFGPGKQFANFGSVGTAWIFSNERFLNSWSLLTFGKLRGSYGITGNDQIGDYKFLNTFSSIGTTYSGIPGLYPTGHTNPNYAWETTKKFELALELGLLDNRINLTTAYYNNRSSNQLINYTLAATSGFPSVLRNFPAKIENSGLEFEVNSVNTTRNVKWTTSFNVSIPKNKLLEFENLESSSYANSYVVGKSLNIRKTYNYLGVDQTTGIYTFEDMNKDGAISFADAQLVNELKTDFHGGMNNSFSYKGWNLDILFSFAKKNASSIYRSFGQPGAYSNFPATYIDQGWTSTRPESNQQRFTTENGDVYEAYNRFQGSQKGYTDASYIKLKNISLTYKLPEKWVKGFQSSLYVRGQNLYTITNFDGLDPETGTFVLAPLRTIIFGINISL